MNFKKIIAAAIAINLIFSVSVLADPLSDRLKDEQQTLKQNMDTYDGVMKQMAEAEQNIQKIDEQISNLTDQIKAIKVKIEGTKVKIKDTEDKIKKLQDQLNAEQELFNKRVKAMYMNGEYGYMEVLMQSKDLNDLLSRLDMIKRVIDYDKGVMSEIKLKTSQISLMKKSLQSTENQLLAYQKQNESKLSELNSSKDSQKLLIADLKTKQDEYSDKISQFQAVVDATIKEIEERKAAEEAQAAQSTGNRILLASRDGSAPISSNAIVEYAAGFLGTPYVRGGSTPAGFDCSGFTKYVFSHFGVNLNRRAADQASQGSAVSSDNLQPGDLVFFGNPAYHVGIYVGNGLFIHSPQTGDVVKIASLRWMNFTGARRVR
ncbi:MAG: NlpC/P60 family protein [Clostridiales bacterium]|nr:NlpC/P60 family protein [Clostridiales bacterium]